MVIETDSAFISEKNKPTNAPIWLYRLDMQTGNPADDLFLAERDTNIGYFRTDAGVDTAQTYIKFPIKHGGIPSNAADQIDSLTVTIANVSREMQAFIEANDGLRGRRVTIRQVFANLLSDPAAHVEDVYTIDYPDWNQDAVTFHLTSKLAVLSVSLPGRRFTRDHCSHAFKGRGCWLDDGDGTFSQPGGSGPWTGTCDKTLDGAAGCKYHGNRLRFGGFPGIPYRRIFRVG